MKRSLILILWVTLLTVFAGCENDPAGNSRILNEGVPSLAKVGGDPVHQELLDSLIYEEIEGSITPGMAGWLHFTMKTWPKNCNFALNIPADALPGDDPTPVPFSIRVPTYKSYMEHADYNDGEGLPLILRLEPSNLMFHAPVSVMVTYMPWTGVTAADSFTHWTVDPVYEEFGDVIAYQDRNRVRIIFPVPHFSDWEVEDVKK